MEWATVLTSRAPERVEELDLTAGDFIKVLQKFGDGWFKGSNRGHVGLVPTTHVKMHKHLFPVRVEHVYQAQLLDELSLNIGDLISVLDDDLEDAGWWLGEFGGKVGLFPNNFVEMLERCISVHGKSLPPKEKNSKDTFESCSDQEKARTSAPHPIPPNNLYEEINQSGDTARLKSPPPDIATATESNHLKEELAKIRFSFEWFSMRHAKTVSQMVDEIEEGKNARKRLEDELNELSMMAAHRFN